MTDTTEYFEDLNVGIPCPHTDSNCAGKDQVFYRYIHGGEVKSESFLPTKINTDLKLPKECDDCVQKSVSIFNEMQSLINAVFKLPHHKGKKRVIGVFTLLESDGVLKPTGSKGHYSWWRSKAFDFNKVTTQQIVVQ